MSTYAAEVLADSPSGYWKLNELPAGAANGITAVDDSGNGRNGTYTGGTDLRIGATGLIACGTCMEHKTPFANGGVNCASLAAWQIGTLSLEAWIQGTGTTGFPYMVIARDGGGNVNGFQWRINATNQLQLVLPGTAYVQTATVTLEDGNPHHLVCTIDGTSKQVTQYVDTNQVAQNNYTTTNITGGTAALWLGARAFNTGANVNRGYLDECAFYPSVLSSTRVSAHYAARFAACSEGRIWGWGKASRAWAVVGAMP